MNGKPYFLKNDENIPAAVMIGALRLNNTGALIATENACIQNFRTSVMSYMQVCIFTE